MQVDNLLRAVVTFVLVGLTTSCFGWNKPAHEVTALVAYAQLRHSHEDIIEAVARLMAAHPASGSFKHRMESGGATRELQLQRLFMEMAQWPDEVRKAGQFHEYNRPTWHYINIPFVPRASVLKAQTTDRALENIFTAFSENVRIATDRTQTLQDRSVALCWMFHLIGDVHQPLHTTALFDSLYPDGDRGGNLVSVHVTPHGKSINLHAFWDGAVIGSQRAQSVSNKAFTLISNYPPNRFPQLTTRTYKDAATFEHWGRQESHQLALSVAYANVAYDDNASLLGEAYVRRAKNVANAQVALAGYRLAQVLIAMHPHLVH
jgi:hypothetical protein